MAKIEIFEIKLYKIEDELIGRVEIDRLNSPIVNSNDEYINLSLNPTSILAIIAITKDFINTKKEEK